MSTLIELVHEGQHILVDGQTEKLDRFEGRCAAWTDEVEGGVGKVIGSHFPDFAKRSAARSRLPAYRPASWASGRSREGGSMR